MARFTLPRDLYHGKGALENLKTLTGKKAIVGYGGGDFFAFFAWILSLSVVIRCYLFFCLAFLPVFALNFSAAFIANTAAFQAD